MFISIQSKLARLALGLAAISMFSACTTTTMVSDPLALPAKSVLKPVTLSITANTSEIRGLNQIALKRLTDLQRKGEPDATEDLYVLRQIAQGMARDTSLFVGALPPGEYAFSSFADTTTNKILRMSDKSTMLDHIVVGQQPVDLGRLILTPRNLKVVYGRSTRITDNQSLLQRFSPPHAALFSGAVATGWKKGAKAAAGDFVEPYAMSRPVGADCVTELADGSIVAASRVGTVLKRSAAGRWSALRGDGLESLLCVIEVNLPDAELVAVGEFNTLLRKPRGENKLVPLNPGNLPTGNLLRLFGNPEAGWFIAAQHGTTVGIYHSKQLDGGSWTQLRNESVAQSLWSGATAFFMWKTDNGFAYANSDGPFHFYDFTSASWSEHAVPKKARIVALSETRNGAMGLLTSPGGGFAGIFATSWHSKDAGKTWLETQSPFKIKTFPVQFTQEGAMLMVGGVMSTAEIQISKDNGHSWTHYAPYDLQYRFQVLKNGDLIDYNGGQYGLFSIRYSSDAGKTWKTEYSNFDTVAYDRDHPEQAKK